MRLETNECDSAQIRVAWRLWEFGEQKYELAMNPVTDKDH
jgi:hypothetical protein